VLTLYILPTPRSFLVINVCNQGKTLCSTCTFCPHFMLTLYILPTLYAQPVHSAHTLCSSCTFCPHFMLTLYILPTLYAQPIHSAHTLCSPCTFCPHFMLTLYILHTQCIYVFSINMCLGTNSDYFLYSVQ
jgi:hypothetical protein